MLERLDYELLTSEMAADLLATKDGKKYVVAFASTTDQNATRPNELTRLHAAVIKSLYTQNEFASQELAQSGAQPEPGSPC